MIWVFTKKHDLWLQDITESTLTIGILAPLKTNGYIIKYNVYLSETLLLTTNSDSVVIGEEYALKPATKYVFKVYSFCSTST